MLSDKGVKEVTLLGQNVNSYADFGKGPRNSIPFSSRSGETDGFDAHYAPGFKSVYVPSRQGATTFAHLLDAVARVDPEMRIRFTSPHPKDFADDVLSVMALHHNVCKQVHMPAQSGSTSVLSRMRRGYGREAYDALVSSVRAQLPGVALSTDMIAGFCGETEEEHRMSVDLLREHKYDQAFLFAYSEREKTHAARHFEDDVSQETKLQRLQELIETYRAGLLERGAQEVGRTHLVLVEGPSKRSDGALTGRTDTFKRVVFDDVAVPAQYIETAGQTLVKLGVGDYVAVKIVQGGGGVLSGVPLGRTTMTEFIQKHGCAVPL
jgi:tRNA A37 methylthiotransferase MiaB